MSAKKKVLPPSRPIIYLLFNTNELGNSSDVVREMDYAFLGSYATKQDAVIAWANHMVEVDNDLESKYFSKNGKLIKTEEDLEKEGWKILWTEVPEGVWETKGVNPSKKTKSKISKKTSFADKIGENIHTLVQDAVGDVGRANELLEEIKDEVREIEGTKKTSKTSKKKVARKTKATPKKAAAKKIDISHSDRFSFEREVELSDDFDNPKENDNPDRWPIYSITFPITRYEEFSHTLKFKKGVSEKKAIDAVEEYLSQPMTEAYWKKIKSDLDGYMDEEEVAEGTNRGRAVGDAALTQFITLTERDNVPKSRQTTKGKRHVIISYEY